MNLILQELQNIQKRGLQNPGHTLTVMLPEIVKSLESSAATEERLKFACSKMNQEVCQTLGKALGYPWFRDDPKNFPGVTEADGVCVGEHVAESIASEAAKRIVALEAEIEKREVAAAQMREAVQFYAEPGSYGATARRALSSEANGWLSPSEAKALMDKLTAAEQAWDQDYAAIEAIAEGHGIDQWGPIGDDCKTIRQYVEALSNKLAERDKRIAELEKRAEVATANLADKLAQSEATCNALRERLKYRMPIEPDEEDAWDEWFNRQCSDNPFSKDAWFAALNWVKLCKRQFVDWISPEAAKAKDEEIAVLKSSQEDHRGARCATCLWALYDGDYCQNPACSWRGKSVNDHLVHLTTQDAMILIKQRELKEAEAAAMRRALESAFNGLKWYRAEFPEADSQGDDEMNSEIETALSTTSGAAMLKEMQNLKAWKEEEMQVESQWDCQAVGRLIGSKLGEQIKPQIQPYIEWLQADLASAYMDGYAEALAASRQMNIQLLDRASKAEEELAKLKAEEDEKIADLLIRIDLLRQAHWDGRAIGGFDNDGDATPKAVVSDFCELIRQDWKSIRESLDELEAGQGGISPTLKAWQIVVTNNRDMSARLFERTKQLQEAKAMLKKLEWEYVWSQGMRSAHCTCCDSNQLAGHLPDCKLHAILSKP